MFHEPDQEHQDEDFAAQFKTKLGIQLFLVYSAVFAGFVVLNTFTPSLMGMRIFLGLNLAIVYGFFLIIFAVVLGIVYNIVCTAKEKELHS